MKFFLVGILALTLAAGCTTTSSSSSSSTSSSAEKQMPEMITGEDYDEYGGADAYGDAGNHPTSLYWGNPDFYRMTSTESFTIIPGFQTFLQTTEWSCGAAIALAVLDNPGVEGYTEWEIAIGAESSVDQDTVDALPGTADNFYEYGTNVGGLYQFFQSVPGIEIVESSYRETYDTGDLIQEEDGYSPVDVGNVYPTFSAMSLYASENDDATEAWVEDAKDSFFVQWVLGHLENGNPIMVEWADWDGHWQAIIGYDTMGTPSLGDDVIIFADPYDTSDHWQDGYYYYPAERWFYMWKDRNVAPKPFQLQPYIIVTRSE